MWGFFYSKKNYSTFFAMERVHPIDYNNFGNYELDIKEIK